MMTTATKPTSLAEITREEQAAAAAAQKAAEAASEAKARADRAREHADRERESANRDYLGLLAEEWPEARQQATEALGEAHQDLDAAVRGDSDSGVFHAYRAWISASIAAWEIDEGLARMRRFHGISARETPPPTFSFAHDFAALIDQAALELQDEAVERIDQRRAEYLAGRTSS